MDQGLAETDALAVAVRQRPDVLAEHARQATDLDDVLHPLAEVGLGDRAKRRDELQILPDRHLAVHGGALR